ncbi:MAG: GNAT family N-acetyltransferase [Reinekea sp.]|nr:GNAT family N-acetyltransferase [Reinekea sp.]
MDYRQTSDSLVIRCLPFEQLDTNSLYDLLSLRMSVFCVEQNCPYQDADGKDQNAWHVLAYRQGELVGTARVLMPGVSYADACSIGRVANRIDQRGRKVGQQVMQRAVRECETLFPDFPIRIGAQRYLTNFYRQFGFEVSSSAFLEDGIVHVSMEKPALSAVR